jgi:hypothetical protein
MALSNAERQRRFIARLRAGGEPTSSGDAVAVPWPTILVWGDPPRSKEEAASLPTGWAEIELAADDVLDRVSSRAFGAAPEQRLRGLRDLVRLMEYFGPPFLSAAKRYLSELENNLQETAAARRGKGKSASLKQSGRRKRA